jgi:hypothetical protein
LIFGTKTVQRTSAFDCYDEKIDIDQDYLNFPKNTQIKSQEYLRHPVASSDPEWILSENW